MPYSFKGACSAPLCPKRDHDRYYDKATEAVYLSPQSDTDRTSLANRFTGGAVQGVHLCLDFEELLTSFQEYQRAGRAKPLRWHPGAKLPGWNEEDLLAKRLQPEWRNVARGHLYNDARSS